jgi:hypothetical protein
VGASLRDQYYLQLNAWQREEAESNAIVIKFARINGLC